MRRMSSASDVPQQSSLIPKMPAGSYVITEPEDLRSKLTFVWSTDGLCSTAIFVIGTQSPQPQRQTVVVFEKYGETIYLDKVLIDGDTSGVMALPTKAEKRAEGNASVTEQISITAGGL
jgi:hypothetical protein